MYLSKSDEEKDVVVRWYYRGQLSYIDVYINLFISYNAWFKKVTDTHTDRDAINALKQRTVIWDEFLAGKTLYGLKTILSEIVNITDEKPLENLTGSNRHWDGVVRSDQDWRSLIEFWYRARCNLFHGSKSPKDYRDSEVVRLAYESLNIFMGEIVRRMESNFSMSDLHAMHDLSRLADLLAEKLACTDPGSDEWKRVHQEYEDAQSQYSQLSGAFDEAYDLWGVDMEESRGR